MHPASPSDLPQGPGCQTLPDPFCWGSLGHIGAPARTVSPPKRKSRLPDGSSFGSVSTLDVWFNPQCSSPQQLPSIYPPSATPHCTLLSPLCPSDSSPLIPTLYPIASRRMHRIRSVPAQWAGCLFRQLFFRGRNFSRAIHGSGV